MRIAMFTDLFWPINSGVATSIMNSSQWLAKRGHKVMIFAPYTANAPVQFGKNIIVHYCKPMTIRFVNYKGVYLARPGFDVLRKLMDFKPDVIHSHTPSLIGWTAMLFSRLFNVPLVGTYHGFLQDFLEHVSLPKPIVKSRLAKRITWNYARQYFNRCDLIVVPSMPVKSETTKNGFNGKKIAVISNGVNLRIFYPKRTRKRGNVILHVGRLSYEKQINVVVRAFKILAKSDKNAVLVIVGTGPQESQLKRMAGSLLGNRIIFTGHIKHEKLARYYSSSSIFVTASTIETEGLVILEAMACGLPVVGVDVRAIPFIVRHGVNGYIAQEGDAVGIACFSKRLLDSPKEREKFGKESLLIAKEFSVEKTARRLENAYLEVVDKKKKSAGFTLPSLLKKRRLQSIRLLQMPWKHN